MINIIKDYFRTPKIISLNKLINFMNLYVLSDEKLNFAIIDKSELDSNA